MLKINLLKIYNYNIYYCTLYLIGRDLVRSRICEVGFSGCCPGLGCMYPVLDTLGSGRERSRLCTGGLGSSPPALTDRLIAEWGINAPGGLKGYKDLK